MSSPKRVVLLIADDWSPLAGCYGSKLPDTPFIDELARTGTTFHRAYCTSPSCGPSRACILTGLHSYSHGQYGNPHGPFAFRVAPWVRPITREFQEAGIRTGIIGKRHILPLESFGWDFHSTAEKIISKAQTLEDLGSFFEVAGHDPFFLMMASSLPHRTSGGFDHANYEGLALREYSPEEVTVPDFLPDLPGVRQDLANYYSGITRFDEWVGSVLEEFKRRDLYEGTLFMVLSDHGMPFLGAKASPFEGGHHCPLIACCPGSGNPEGQNSHCLVSWLDLAPTIAEWLGVDAPSTWPGRSLAGILRGQDEQREEVYLSHLFHGLLEYYPYRIVCRQRWKYILRLDPDLPLPLPADLIVSLTNQAILEALPDKFGCRSPADVFYGPAEALYDLENDPGESKNLANDPSCTEILVEMRAAMEKHRIATQDPLLPKTNQGAWREAYPRKA